MTGTSETPCCMTPRLTTAARWSSIPVAGNAQPVIPSVKSR